MLSFSIMHGTWPHVHSTTPGKHKKKVMEVSASMTPTKLAMPAGAAYVAAVDSGLTASHSNKKQFVAMHKRARTQESSGGGGVGFGGSWGELKTEANKSKWHRSLISVLY